MQKVKLQILALLVFCSLGTSAQIFRIGTGLGLGGGLNSVGLSINLLELGYAPSPKMEYGAYLGATLNAAAKKTSGNASGGIRYGVQGKYYFREEGFKPYAGVQAGVLSGGWVDASLITTTANAERGKRFDFAPMLGFRVGPLNINAAYQSGVKLNFGFLFGFGNFK